jgi:S-adenosylmethionine hydrolase
MVGGADRAVRLENPEYHLATVAARSESRDVLAPVAAHLCNGVPLEEFGPEVDPAGLLPSTFPLTRTEDGQMFGEVLWVDHFGNVQLNLDPDEIGEFGDRFELLVGTEGRRVGTVGRVNRATDVGTGAIGMMLDSYGMLSLVANRFPASEQLGVAAGDAISLVPLLEGDAQVATAVSLGCKPEANG